MNLVAWVILLFGLGMFIAFATIVATHFIVNEVLRRVRRWQDNRWLDRYKSLNLYSRRVQNEDERRWWELGGYEGKEGPNGDVPDNFGNR